MPVLTSITLVPGSTTIAQGLSTGFTATGHYSNGASQNITASVVWSSDATNVAVINTVGIATAAGTGSANITASSGGVTASALMTVTPPALKTITVSPSGKTMPAGTSQQFTAAGLYTDGTTADVTGVANWVSSAPTFAPVSPTGSVTGLAVKNLTISAVIGSVVGKTSLIISNPSLTAITLTSPTVSMPKNTSVQVTAMGQYSDGSTRDVTSSAVWSSGTPTQATVWGGLVSGLAIGTSTITATLSSVSRSLVITVNGATLTSVNVRSNVLRLGAGQVQQLVSIATYSNGSTLDATRFATWSCLPSAVATINNLGLLSTVGAGTASVTASIGTTSGKTAIFVAAPVLISLSVYPATVQAHTYVPQAFTATGTYSDGSTSNLTQAVTWSSSNSSVAQISNSTATKGTASFVGTTAGSTTTITAAIGGNQASASLTVNGSALSSLSILPASAPAVAPLSLQQFTAIAAYSDASSFDVSSVVHWGAGDGTIATILNSAPAGRLTGIAPGLVTVTASLGGFAANNSLIVSGATLQSMVVSPSSGSTYVASPLQFTSTAFYSDGSSADVTSLATWSAADPVVIALLNGLGPNGLAEPLRAGVTTAISTLGGVTGSASVTVSATPQLMTIGITPAIGLMGAGTTQQYTATGAYTDGSTADITSAVVWSASNTAVNINAAGLARGSMAGTATITAALSGISTFTTLTVSAPVLVSLTIAPAGGSVAKGASVQYSATGSYSDGSTADLTALANWSSSNTAVAGIAASGLVRGLAAGNSTITAVLGGINAFTTLTVSAPVLVSLAVTPAGGSVSVGATQAYVASGTYSDGTAADLSATAVWSSSATLVASVSSTGVASGLTAGNTSIRAASGGISGSSALTVTAAALVTIVVTPGTASIALGTPQQFTATGTYTDGSTQVLTAVIWNSSAPGTASVNGSGLASSLAVGSTTIGATSGGISGSAVLTVSVATLVSIAVSPGTPAVATGVKQAFTATGAFTDGTTQDVTASATWSVANPALATIGNLAPNQGLATTLAAGTVTIMATMGSVSGNATLTVSAPALVSLAVIPGAPSIALGTTQAFTSIGTYTDGSTADLTASVTWASTNTSVATVGNLAPSQGISSTLAAGSSGINATLNGITGSGMLTVTPAAVVSLTITPLSAMAAVGASQAFRATATYTDSTTQDVTDLAHWTAGNGSIATVSDTVPKGVTTAQTIGSVPIAATYNAATSTASLTVTAPPITTIGTPGLPWIKVAGVYGGSLQCFAEDSGTLYAGASGNGIFISYDQGQTWSLTPGLRKIDATKGLNSIVIDTAHNLYVATEGGVYKSINQGVDFSLLSQGTAPLSGVRVLLLRVNGDLLAGSNVGLSTLPAGSQIWKQAQPLPARYPYVFSMVLDASQTTLFVGSYGSNAIFSTRDWGTTWSTSSSIPGYTSGNPIATLATDASGYVYAGIGINQLGTTTGGVAISPDGGNTWRPLNLTSAGVSSLLYSAGTLFVGTQSVNGGGQVYLSHDQGATFLRVTAGLDVTASIYSIRSLSTGLYLGTNGAYTSVDGGNTWSALNVVIDRAVHAVLSTSNGDIYVASQNEGVSRSRDNGLTWSVINAGLDGNLSISILALNSLGEVVGSPSRTIGKSVRLPGNGNTWVQSDLQTTFLGFGRDRRNDLVAVAGTGYGVDTYISTDGGSHFVFLSHVLRGWGTTGAVSPAGDIYGGTEAGGGSYSTDNGLSWISLGPTPNNTGFGFAPNGDALLYQHRCARDATHGRHQLGHFGCGYIYRVLWIQIFH